MNINILGDFYINRTFITIHTNSTTIETFFFHNTTNTLTFRNHQNGQEFSVNFSELLTNLSSVTVACHPLIDSFVIDSNKSSRQLVVARDLASSQVSNWRRGLFDHNSSPPSSSFVLGEKCRWECTSVWPAVAFPVAVVRFGIRTSLDGSCVTIKITQLCKHWMIRCCIQ